MRENTVVTKEGTAAPEFALPPRRIAQRTRGYGHGPITRLMSPGDIGQVVKPFVFLDLFQFDSQARMPMEMGWHPHSGIATVTVVLDGAVRYAETTGKSGVLPEGGVEYMRAGGGVWHTGGAEPGHLKGFQLWVALPPELENAANASSYLRPDEVPVAGPARVILGEYGGVKSPIELKTLTYLSVSLKAGERWTYAPPLGHDVAWLSVADGALKTPAPVSAGEMAVFEDSEQAIDLVAEGPARFVIGSAIRHPHPLHLGSYSVHTSAEALRRGQTEIRRIGRELQAQGVI